MREVKVIILAETVISLIGGNMKIYHQLAAIVVCCFLSGCHYLNGPVIFNNCTFPVYVEFQLSDGYQSSVKLGSHSASWVGVEGLHFLRLSAEIGGKKIALNEKEIDRMRADKRVKEELWVTRPNSIELMDLSKVQNQVARGKTL